MAWLALRRRRFFESAKNQTDRLGLNHRWFTRYYSRGYCETRLKFHFQAQTFSYRSFHSISLMVCDLDSRNFWIRLSKIKKERSDNFILGSLALSEALSRVQRPTEGSSKEQIKLSLRTFLNLSLVGGFLLPFWLQKGRYRRDYNKLSCSP